MASVDKIQTWLNESLKEIKHDQFKQCVKVKVDDENSATGQMVVVSEIRKVKVTLEYESGKNNSFNAVVKAEPTANEMNTFAMNTGFFENEIMVYQNILPAMEKLLQSKNKGTRDIFWPICYHCSQGVLMFENLCEKNYTEVRTDNLLGMDDMTLVLQRIGEFHGMSMVLIERGLLNMSAIKPTIFASEETNFMVQPLTMSVSTVADVIKKDWPPEWSEAADKLMRSIQNMGGKLCTLAKASQGKCDVICHGDFTLRNMLFQYQSGKLHDVKFLDFQTTCYANPSFDLILLLNSSMDPQVKDENLASLLGIYTKSLRETLQKYDYKGTYPTLDVIQSGYEALSYYGMLISLFAIPIFLAAGLKDFGVGFPPPEDADQGPNMQFDQMSFYKFKPIKDNLMYLIKRYIDKNII